MSGDAYFIGVYLGVVEEYDIKKRMWNDAIYLCLRITNAPGEFINDGGIFDCANRSSVLTSSSDNYEGNSRYYNFTQSGKEMEEPLAP